MRDVAPDWKPGEPIGYIRSEAPEFALPPYLGDRCEAVVPDTLDLQERARVIIQAMTEPTDPLADYEIYWLVFFHSTPPQMQHDWGDPTVQPKFRQALPLMRIVSGSEQNLHVERKWMEVTLKTLGADGLVYTPVRGRPWAFRRWQGREGLGGDQLLVPFTCGVTLSAATILARRDGDGLWRDVIRRLVDGLIGLAVDAGEIAYFWPSVMHAAKERPAQAEQTTDSWGGGESSRVPHGLVHAYRVSGYEPALALAGKVINYLRRHFFADDGAFLNGAGTSIGVHFHSHSHALLAMAEYAETVGDDGLMEFVVRSFEWARSWGLNGAGRGARNPVRAPGADLLGYFPEALNTLQWENSEICEVADMITLALKLSELGAGDYWDDADRWTRNMFAEGQFLRTDWVYRIPTMGLTNPYPPSLLPTTVGPHDTGDRAPERNLGAFGGYSSANDWYVGDGIGIMHCCTANGALAIYRIWDRILRHGDGKLRVNQLLNRASPWADVDSYLPYEGRVDVRIKRPVDLSIRIPEWVKPSETRCQVNDEDRRVAWAGRYAGVGSVKPGEMVTLTFPIVERTDVIHVEKQRFTVARKGNEVVSIEPSGRYYPLYQRQHCRVSTPRWTKVTRFVSAERFDW